MKRIILSATGLLLSFGIASAQMQISNSGFENWETLDGPISNTYEEPIDWNSANECTAIVNQFSVTKSTDTYEGDHSVRLESRSTAFPGVIANGVVTTANMICLAQGGGQEGGIPYTDAMLPDSIVGWYKYAPAQNDSAYLQLMFLANGDQDTVSYTRGVMFEEQTQWSRFSFPIEPASSDPEKLSLIFSSSWGDGSQGQAVVGSVFFVDQVSLVYNGVGVGDAPQSSVWDVYPNPATDVVRVKMPPRETAFMEVYDMTGKRIATHRILSNGQQVDVNGVVPGLYIYQLTLEDGSTVRTGKLFVNR